MPKRPVFQAAEWVDGLMTAFQGYCHIDDLVSHPSLSHYLDSKVLLFPTDDGREVRASEVGNRALRAMIKAEIEEAKRQYAQQMVVVAVTYLELILKEFLDIVFRAFPDRMRDFTAPGGRDDARGLVSFKEILKFRSKTGLLQRLAEQATANALKGKFGSHLTNFEKLTGSKLTEASKKELVTVVELRNQIVHEHSRKKLSIYDLLGVRNCLVRFIVTLAGTATRLKISLDEELPATGFDPFLQQLDEDRGVVPTKAALVTKAREEVTAHSAARLIAPDHLSRLTEHFSR